MKYRFTVPLEEPRGKSYMKSYHVCFSRKLARKISALGQLQFDNLLCLEMDHRVLWYCERPLKQKYHVDGRGITVCPSVYVVYADGTDAFQLVISKPDESKAVDEFSLWGVSANEHIEILGHKDIYKGPFWMRNISYLLGKARRVHGIDAGADDAFLRYLSIKGPMTIGQLITAGRITSSSGFDYLADLYFRGAISFTGIEDKQISYKTEVHCNGEQKN